MPIKNKPFFVPKSFPYQPDFYTEYFGHVNAVFTHPAKGCTLFLEVEADTWNHDRYLDAHGNLAILCQTANGRHLLTPRNIPTLKDALEKLKEILNNEQFGEKLPNKPIKADPPTSKFLPRPEKKPRIRRKGNGRPFRLTKEDRKTLLDWGFPEDELAQIEEAANRSTYVLDDEKPINVWDVINILGKETFLSGIRRSAFHWTSSRNTEDGKHEVSFDSSILFR